MSSSIVKFVTFYKLTSSLPIVHERQLSFCVHLIAKLSQREPHVKIRSTQKYYKGYINNFLNLSGFKKM